MANSVSSGLQGSKLLLMGPFPLLVDYETSPDQYLRVGEDPVFPSRGWEYSGSRALRIHRTGKYEICAFLGGLELLPESGARSRVEFLEAFGLFESLNLRPFDALELIAFGVEYPEVHSGHTPIYAFHGLREAEGETNTRLIDFLCPILKHNLKWLGSESRYSKDSERILHPEMVRVSGVMGEKLHWLGLVQEQPREEEDVCTEAKTPSFLARLLRH